MVIEDQKRGLADEGLVKSFISFSHFASAGLSVKKKKIWFDYTNEITIHPRPNDVG